MHVKDDWSMQLMQADKADAFLDLLRSFDDKEPAPSTTETNESETMAINDLFSVVELPAVMPLPKPPQSHAATKSAYKESMQLGLF